MRTWVKVTLGGVALVAVVVLALAGVGAYFVLGNMNKRDAGEAEALRDIDAIRARFGARRDRRSSPGGHPNQPAAEHRRHARRHGAHHQLER